MKRTKKIPGSYEFDIDLTRADVSEPSKSIADTTSNRNKAYKSRNWAEVGFDGKSTSHP